jgi:hypothetical protein
MPTINELVSISNPPDDSVVVVTDAVSSKKITVSDLRNTMVRPASTTLAGSVKVGSGLAIDATGTLSVTNYSGYTLPKASGTRLGGVIVGDGLTMNSQGVVSVESLVVPVASYDSAGIVRVGNGLVVQDGVLSNPVSAYVLPVASQSTLGGVKIGYGLEVNNELLAVKTRSFLVEGNQIIDVDHTVSGNRTVYSVSPVTIDRNVTVTVGADSSWVIYTPGIAMPAEPIPTTTPIQESVSLIDANYTIGDNRTASSVGPITVGRAVTVTIPALSTWVIF